VVLWFRMLPYVVDLGGPLNYYGLSHMGESHPLLVKDYCRFSFLQHRMPYNMLSFCILIQYIEEVHGWSNSCFGVALCHS
jgi:hypothetical protein